MEKEMLGLQRLEPQKRKVPQIKMLLLWPKGHIKKKCFIRDLHQMLQLLKGLSEEKKILKKKETMLDQLKSMEFKKDGENVTMFHKG